MITPFLNSLATKRKTTVYRKAAKAIFSRLLVPKLLLGNTLILGSSGFQNEICIHVLEKTSFKKIIF